MRDALDTTTGLHYNSNHETLLQRIPQSLVKNIKFAIYATNPFYNADINSAIQKTPRQFLNLNLHQTLPPTTILLPNLTLLHPPLVKHHLLPPGHDPRKRTPPLQPRRPPR